MKLDFDKVLSNQLVRLEFLDEDDNYTCYLSEKITATFEFDGKSLCIYIDEIGNGGDVLTYGLDENAKKAMRYDGIYENIDKSYRGMCLFSYLYGGI
jgi:hypothetical protein